MVTNIETVIPATEQTIWHETNPSGDRTVLLVGGITEGISTLGGLTDALGNEGFRVLSYDQTAKPADVRDETDEYFARYHTNKVEQVGDIIEAAPMNGEKISLFAHSQGAVFAIEAALKHADKVDKVILANPAGLFDDSFKRLAGRFAVETVRKTFTPTKLAQKQQINGTKSMVSHPKSFLGDAVDIGHGDIRNQIRELRGRGVRVDVLVGAKDQVFPWRLMEKGINPDGEIVPEEIVVDSISSYVYNKVKRSGKVKQRKFAGKWAGHDQPIIYPKQTARLIKQLLSQ